MASPRTILGLLFLSLLAACASANPLLLEAVIGGVVAAKVIELEKLKEASTPRNQPHASSSSAPASGAASVAEVAPSTLSHAAPAVEDKKWFKLWRRSLLVSNQLVKYSIATSKFVSARSLITSSDGWKQTFCPLYPAS